MIKCIQSQTSEIRLLKKTSKEGTKSGESLPVRPRLVDILGIINQ